MSKFGVGVGEEFPVDENDRPQADQHEHGHHHHGEGGCGDADWHRQRELRREAWQRFRHQMHAEWHARRRAFRDHLREHDAVETLDVRERHLAHLVLGGLALIGLAALLSHRHDR